MGPGPDAETAIVDALYRGACDEGELQRAIDKIATAFDCPSLLLGDLDTDHPEKTSLMGAGMMDAGQIEHYKTFAHLDYATPVLARLPPGTAGLTYRLLDETKVRRLPFHDAFVRPLSIDHALASPLHVSGSRIAMVALHQVEGRRVLDQGHVAALERDAPSRAGPSCPPRLPPAPAPTIDLYGDRRQQRDRADRSRAGRVALVRQSGDARLRGAARWPAARP